MHNAAEQLASEYAAPVQEAHLAVAGIDHSRQESPSITADKFRSLKARLSSGAASSGVSPAPAPTIPIPDLLQKVRSVRQSSNFVDVWAELEKQLTARPLPVEEIKPENPAPSELELNGVTTIVEPADTSVIEAPAELAELSPIDAVSDADEVAQLETPPETAPAELIEVEQPALELSPENLPAESQEPLSTIEEASELSAAVAPDETAVELEVIPSEPPSEQKELHDSLAERLGSQVSILRKLADEDAFDESQSPAASVLALPSEPVPGSTPTASDIEQKDANASVSNETSTGAPVNSVTEPAGETDPQAGEVARSLLDIMSAPSGATQPQERALAADMLLRLVPRIPMRPMIALVDRICVMEPPPPLLVARLIKDKRPDIAGPLLERCTYIADQDLLDVIAERDPARQRMVARRRHLSAALTDALVERGDPSGLLTLVRNPGAVISHDAFYRLCLHAKEHHALQAPLTTRADTPAPVAFELFWLLPVELRRYVLSRFLTDSETLNKLLKMASAVDMSDGAEASDTKFPEKKLVDRLVDLIETNNLTAAVTLMKEIANIHEFTARRIIADADGEPVTVVFKAMGMTRAGFADAIGRIIASPNTKLRQDRNAVELQNIFDSLSFNKARVLLTYWDWAADATGNVVQPQLN